jgi:hypothetical protein
MTPVYVLVQSDFHQEVSGFYNLEFRCNIT